MKKLFIIVILIFLNACTFVKYKSVSNPIIEMPNNEYLITNKNMKYEGNSSVIDINNGRNKYQTIIIEDDGTYYYLD